MTMRRQPAGIVQPPNRGMPRKRPDSARCAPDHGVPQDHAEVPKWFRMAAEHWIANAQIVLGLFRNKDNSSDCIPKSHRTSL